MVLSMASTVRKAVFPAGGLGTRFLPQTKTVPKEMLPVVDKPVIQYIFEEAVAAGIEQFIIVTSRGKTVLEDHFDSHFELEHALETRGKTAELADLRRWLPPEGHVAFTRQRRPLGLGHAVWCARELVGDEPFAVLLPDDLVLADTPCLKQMVDVHAEAGGNVIATMEVPAADTAMYGVIDPAGATGNPLPVHGLVEKPDPAVAPSNLAVIGRYILQPEVFRHLDAMERGAGNEIQLTDAMAKLIGQQPFHGLKFAGRRFDCGDKLGYLDANIAFAQARPDLAGGLAERLQHHAAATPAS